MNKIFLITVFAIITTSIFAQPKFNDSKLAYQYYKNKEYDKAVVIYKSLYENSSSSRNYFTFYLNCLIQLKELDNAEKLIKKEMRKRPKDLSLLVELGYNYQQQGNTEKANKQYQKAIKHLPADKNQVIRLSNSFRAKRKYGLAKQTLLKGRKLLNNNSLFRNELANVYLVEREYSEMLNEYLDLLSENESQLKNIENRLQAAMYIDVDDEIYLSIKEGVIRKIQQNPQFSVYNELLIWLYVQKKDFRKAFFQAKALDKRNNEEGNRLMNLGRLAFSNNDLDVAGDIFKYIIKKGSSNNNFFNAKKLYLKVSYNKLIIQNKTDAAHMSEIAKLYDETIDEFGVNVKTAGIVKDYSHILAFYLDNTNKAKEYLQRLMNLKALKKDFINLCKLELADIDLFDGNIWEAALLYAQIENDNEESIIGHEAKLRKAKLAYYSGDFLWAQAQLDVLKASTSKLIANDAFALSMLITENTGLDTSETAMKLYASAELYEYRKQDSMAFLTLDSILTMFPNHSLTDEVLFKKAEIYLSHQNYDEAIKYLNIVINDYGTDVLGDNALFKLASIYDYNKNDPDEAEKLYKKLMTDYEGSIYIVEARKRYRAIRGDSVDEEINP